MMLMDKKEIWKDVKGYEGIYQVSNLGRVRSLDRMAGRNRLYKGRVIMERTHNTGYKFVRLCRNNKFEQPSIHRLVAEAFIPNPNNKPTVNHIDENKGNNIVTNLEWATYKENCNHGTRNIRAHINRDEKKVGEKVRQTRKKLGMCHKINQYDLEGNFLKQYECAYDACVVLNCKASGIGAACRHTLKTYKGYKWEYAQ